MAEDDFIRSSYLTLLNREPDKSGREFYAKSLNDGMSREDLLVRLRLSDEGKIFGAEIAGLKELVASRAMTLGLDPDDSRLSEDEPSNLEHARGDLQLLSLKAIRARDVTTLLGLHDERFVRSLFLTLLHREVDEEGLTTYLGHVRRGVDKAELVWRVSISEEARARANDITGIAALNSRFGRYQWPLLGPLLRALLERESDSVRMKALRIVENELGALRAEVLLAREEQQALMRTRVWDSQISRDVVAAFERALRGYEIRVLPALSPLAEAQNQDEKSSSAIDTPLTPRGEHLYSRIKKIVRAYRITGA